MYSCEFHSISIRIYPSNLGYSCKFERFLKSYFLEIHVFLKIHVYMWSIPVFSCELYSIPLYVHPSNLGYSCVFLYIPVNSKVFLKTYIVKSMVILYIFVNSKVFRPIESREFLCYPVYSCKLESFHLIVFFVKSGVFLYILVNPTVFLRIPSI